jgi:hypothetical protein
MCTYMSASHLCLETYNRLLHWIDLFWMRQAHTWLPGGTDANANCAMKRITGKAQVLTHKIQVHMVIHGALNTCRYKRATLHRLNVCMYARASAREIIWNLSRARFLLYKKGIPDQSLRCRLITGDQSWMFTSR